MTEKTWIALIGDSTRFFYDKYPLGTMDDWVGRTNKRLLEDSSETVRIVDWFGNNGNLVLTSQINDINHISSLFYSASNQKIVLLTLSEAYFFIQKMAQYSCEKIDLLWNKGIGFQLSGKRKYFDEFTIDQTRIWCIERGVVGIDKKPSGKTNSACSRKKVKWQKVSRILTKNLGGDWTTRSLPIINGIFERSLQ